MLIEWCHSLTADITVIFRFIVTIWFQNCIGFALPSLCVCLCVCVLYDVRFLSDHKWIASNSNEQPNGMMNHSNFLRALSTKRTIYALLYLDLSLRQSVCCCFLFRFHTAVLFAHWISYIFTAALKFVCFICF